MLTLLALAAAVAEPARLPDPLAAGWRGRAVCERLHEDDAQRVLRCSFPPGAGHERLHEDDAQRVLRCSFPPGAGHERHFHVPHFGYALSGGRMRITDSAGTREVEVRTGSHFTSAGTPWHEALNIGDTTVAYLIVEPKP